MKNKLKKLKRSLIVFVVLLVAFSFTFSAAAFTTYYIDMPITQPTISDSLSYFEVSVRRSSDGAVFGYTFLVSHKSMDESSDVPVSVSLYEDGTRHIVKIYNHTDFPITASYVDSEGNVKNFESALLNGDAIEYRLPYSLTSIKSYGNIFVRDYKGFNTSSIVFQYGSTAKTNALLTSILNALQSQSGSTGSIVGAIEGSTDEITNGGKDYESVDGSTIDSYVDSEAALNSSIETSKSDSVSFLNNFGAFFMNSKVMKGMLFVTNTWQEFFSIKWLSDIITFSLSLGAFSFILGSSVMIIRSVSSDRQAKEPKENKRSSKGEK